jgi:hypothetical protein
VTQLGSEPRAAAAWRTFGEEKVALNGLSAAASGTANSSSKQVAGIFIAESSAKRIVAAPGGIMGTVGMPSIDRSTGATGKIAAAVRLGKGAKPYRP